MKNLLVALDLKKNEELLLSKAAQIAEKFGAKVWVIHTAAPDSEFRGYEDGLRYIREVRAKELRAEHKIIQKIAEGLREKGIDAEGLLVQGPTVETIMQEVKKLHIDLMILGGREPSFFEKILKGNITSEILKKAAIPLLIVPLK